MTAHIHAKQMAEYAKDALKTDKPWKLWEYCHKGSDVWHCLCDHPEWHEYACYRRKKVPNLDEAVYPKITPFKLFKEIDMELAECIKEIGFKKKLNEGRTLKDIVDGYGFKRFRPSYVYLIDIHNKLEKAKKEHGLT